MGPIGSVGAVKSPNMKLEKSVMSVINFAGKSAAKAAKTGATVLKLSKKLMKKIPTLGPILAVFSMGKNMNLHVCV